MRCVTFVAILLGSIAGSSAQVERVLPPFLPEYYRVLWGSAPESLVLLRQGSTNGVTQCVYATSDQSDVVSVESIGCDSAIRQTVFQDMLEDLNRSMTKSRGTFVEITDTEICAEATADGMSRSVFVFAMPDSILLWEWKRTSGNSTTPWLAFREIRELVNRQRYEEARQAGNVTVGRWEKSIGEHAAALLESGQRDAALAVLEELLAAAPVNFTAHLLFARHSPDAAAAANSARIVFRNAEDPGQVAAAAVLAGSLAPAASDWPLLSTNESGLQVILIPLAPCNVWLLEDVAKVYEHITDIPVKVRRLAEPWEWGAPDRVADQREIQRFLAGQVKAAVSFEGWTRAQYVARLTAAVRWKDAHSRYWARETVRRVEEEPGQYCADPYLARLRDRLKSCRSGDVRTMYVGVTEADIYSGDSNYLFSLGTAEGPSPASILSYHMMLGKTLGEPSESRQRLVERMAKELVPASLKTLGIPRSTDPTCPYSYSSGIDRLDQKTLTLSAEVKQALAALRDPRRGTETSK